MLFEDKTLSFLIKINKFSLCILTLHKYINLIIKKIIRFFKPILFFFVFPRRRAYNSLFPSKAKTIIVNLIIYNDC